MTRRKELSRVGDLSIESPTATRSLQARCTGHIRPRRGSLMKSLLNTYCVPGAATYCYCRAGYKNTRDGIRP